MAEVKQVSGSFNLSSSSLKKKPPSFSNNGVSTSSFKHIYDDVFASSSPSKLKPLNTFMEDDDYAEVFGSSKSNNGCWSIPYSSIPIIDLPRKDKEKEKESSKKGGERVDYSGVFAGIDDHSFGLPNGEELFDHLNKKAKIFPRGQGQTTKADRPGISSRSCEQLPTNGFCQSFDNAKRVEPGNNETTINATSGPRKAAHVRASSMHEVSATQKILSSRPPSCKDSEKSPMNGFCQSSDNMKHFEPVDSEMTENAAGGPRKADHDRAYPSHDVSSTHNARSNQRPVIGYDGKAPTNGFSQSSDKMKQFETGNSEMMVNAKSGSRNTAHVRAYSLHEVSSTQKLLSSQTPVIKDDGKSSTNGICETSDNMKHFELGESDMIVNAKSGPRNAAHVRAYSLHEGSDFQKTLSRTTPVINDDTVDAVSNVGKKQQKHFRHTSLDVIANKQSSDGDAGLHKVSSMSGSNSVQKSHGTCQSGKAATNEFCQSYDNSKHSEYKSNDMKNSQFSGGTRAAEVHPDHEPNHTLHELDPTQKTMSSRTSVPNDTAQPGKHEDVAEDQGKHSHDTSLDLGANRQDGKCDTGLQRAFGLHESTSDDNSHETCLASFEARPSKVVNDDAELAVGFGKVKKKGRRSRMTSLDLSDYNNSCEHDGGYQRKPRFGSSYSFDASHDPSVAHVKVQPSKMYPSSSLPQYFPVESHYKVSENPRGKNYQKNMYRGGVDSPPSLVEELDVNSTAAVSAAALQRAIEEAEMRIRWAKAFLEREGQGYTKLRFKDTLKVTVAKENGLADEINDLNQTKIDDIFSPVESEMKPCSPLKRKHVTPNSQEAPASEDQAKFVNDGVFTDGTDAKVSELMREDDKYEGGEWEAAKHLNQIISGVKNKIVSFMSWQTETEKKEDLKEPETNIKHQHHPEGVGNYLEDHEVSKEKGKEKNQGTITSADEAMHGEGKVESASEAVESDENESIRGVNSKEEKVGNKVDVTPDTAVPSVPILQFFAFRNQRLYDPPDSEVDAKEPQEIRESEIMNEQEQVVDEVKDEHLPYQGEEASLEELNDKCVNQENKRQDDMSDIGSNDGENDKTVEEPHFQAMHNAVELSHEEHRQDDMNRKGDICSINEENIEMVEEVYSFAGHHSEELTHELDGQDDMCRKSHIGSTNEENFEIVQEPYSLAGHDVKSFTDEEGGQDDACMKSQLGSSNKENDETLEEFHTPSGYESTDVVHEDDNENCLNEERVEEPLDHSDHCKVTAERADKDGECEELKEAEQQHNNVDILEDINVAADPSKNLEAAEGVKGCHLNEWNEINTNHNEESSEQNDGCEEIKPIQTGNVEETVEQVTVEASCVASAEVGYIHNEDVLLDKSEETSRFVESSSKVEGAVYPDEVIERMIDMNNDPKIDIDIPVSAQTEGELIREEPEIMSLSTESIMEVDSNKLKHHNGFIETLQCETFVSLDTDTDMSSEENNFDVKIVEPQSQDLENQTDCIYESQEKLHLEEYDTASDQDLDMDMSGVEAVHRRRRWFDNRGSIAAAERPSILEGDRTDLEIDQEVLDDSELTGSVEIHADKLECSAAEVATALDAEVSSNQGCNRTNIETTPKRRRWFVNRGEAGVPEPLSLFEGVKVNVEVPLESKNETLLHKGSISGGCLDQSNTNYGESLNAVKSDVVINGENGRQSGEAAPRRKRWFEGRETLEPSQQVRIDGDVAVELDQETKAKGDDAEKHIKPGSMPITQEKDDVHYKMESKEQHIDMDEVNRREKAKEKEKLAVERAIREARERAFAEARERARREAAEKPNVEGREKVAAGVQEKLGKVSSEGMSSSDKASVEAKLKAERAAVERATAEARERALQKSLSEKSFSRSREQAGKFSTEKNSSLDPKYQSSRSSSASNNSDKSEGADVESAQRRKARLERQKRTTERAAKALEEKNRRDLVTQKEQAAKNMLADALDAEVRRWSTGKEGNLLALLSTLQYILGPDSGWQPVSLTDLVAATAVRKAYKKATLCVHPDKLQQRGASIQQKHICEKVFDLLKEAWSKFNPDER